MVSALLVYLVIASNIGSVKSSLTVQRSSVVVFGERVELKCSVAGNDSASWKYTSWNSSTGVNIYLGRDIFISMRSRYKIDKRINGQHNLIIDSVDFGHAGRYRCIGLQNQSLITDIQLIVFGSHPFCAANISSAKNDGRERNHLSIWCSVNYTGNGLPVFSWTKGNAMENIDANTTTFSSSGVTLKTTSLIIQQLQDTDHGVAFQCRITFDISDNAERVYAYTWNYTQPNGPGNLRIVEYKDRLECSADGDPTPTYRWTRVDTKSSIEGPMILLDDNDQTLQCTATNVFGSERKNFTFTKGPGSNERSVCGIHSVGLVVVSSILIIFGIVQLIIGLKLRKLSRAFDKDKTSTNASSFQPHQSSKKLNSPQPTDEYSEIERADATDNTYCALADQPTTAHKTQVYCELRPIDQRNIKQAAKQRAENKER